jgi:hypothetical protein
MKRYIFLLLALLALPALACDLPTGQAQTPHYHVYNYNVNVDIQANDAATVNNHVNLGQNVESQADFDGSSGDSARSTGDQDFGAVAGIMGYAFLVFFCFAIVWLLGRGVSQ